MSDYSLKRTFLLAVSSLLVASAVFAVEPGARYEAQLVYNSKTTRSLLFGGLTATDAGTKVPYELADTWDWNGVRWTLLYPLNSPPARAAHAMVYDSKRNRIVLFGGRTGHTKTDLNDTWTWNGFDWTQVTTNDAPSPRSYSAMAYDSVRDRIVLFGGAHLESDGKTVTTYHDTWEFDGAQWTKVNDNGPDVQKPKMEYDAALNQMIVVAADSSFAAHMYGYDPAASSWNEIKPTTLPGCVSGGSLVYLPDPKLLLYAGGICSSPTSTTEDAVAWDGTNWNPVTAANAPARLFDAAATYDQARGTVLVFGGAQAFAALTTITPVADLNALQGPVWTTIFDAALPQRRSLPVFVTDPDHNNIWMFGGVNDFSSLGDFWSLQYGNFTENNSASGPGACNPTGAYDTDRHKLVVLCTDSTTFEFDGTTWAQITTKDAPPARRFSSMVYDPSLKKTILFGGYDGTNYTDQTWLWDGTNWVRQGDNPPGLRADAMMWYDPLTKKTTLYGGVGRQSSQDRLIWFSDVWSFDGTRWTQVTTSPTPYSAAAGTPGMRYGAEIAVDPRTNKLLLYGGIRIDRTSGDPNTPCSTNSCVSVFADDWWEWDGGAQKWTQKQFLRSPSARENAGFAWDPSQRTMLMFGGYAGEFYSDLWTMTPTADSWTPRIVNPIRVRPSR